MSVHDTSSTAKADAKTALYGDSYSLQGPPVLRQDAEEIYASYAPRVTAERLARIEKVVQGRTESFVLVLDALVDAHNISAILRSADAFGVQTIHIVRGETERERDPQGTQRVSKGVDRWLDLHIHDTFASCVTKLRSEGFAIWVATMGGKHSVEMLSELPRVAAVFGNEHRGPRREWLAEADATFAVPMAGFVESLNVSVAAALTTYLGTRGRRGDLSPDARRVLTARFLLDSAKTRKERQVR